MAKTKVLVVDDEKDVCEFAKDFLEQNNYKVFTAQSGGEALTIFNYEHPAIVLLDIKMDDMNGTEVLKQIKESDSETKVIMVTGYDDEKWISEARRFGADDYVAKPLTTKYLADIVLQKMATLARRSKAKSDTKKEGSAYFKWEDGKWQEVSPPKEKL